MHCGQGIPQADLVTGLWSTLRFRNCFVRIAIQAVGKFAVTKIQHMLTSLVAVVPAVLLAYLLVMAMLLHSENLSTIAYVVMGLTLLSTIGIAVIPVAILVGGKRQPARSSKSSVNAISTVNDDVGLSSAVSAVVEADVDQSDIGDFELDESGQSLIELENSAQSLVDLEDEADFDTEPVEDFEDFAFEEEEEEPKPKKKKR